MKMPFSILVAANAAAFFMAPPAGATEVEAAFNEDTVPASTFNIAAIKDDALDTCQATLQAGAGAQSCGSSYTYDLGEASFSCSTPSSGTSFYVQIDCVSASGENRPTVYAAPLVAE